MRQVAARSLLLHPSRTFTTPSDSGGPDCGRKPPHTGDTALPSTAALTSPLSFRRSRRPGWSRRSRWPPPARLWSTTRGCKWELRPFPARESWGGPGEAGDHDWDKTQQGDETSVELSGSNVLPLPEIGERTNTWGELTPHTTQKD